MKYGFLFQGYIPSCYFWETIIMFRKIGIIMATVFFSTISADLQVLVVLFIIVISMFVQIKFTPYYTQTLNNMENYSLQVAALTLYQGMFYVTGSSYMDDNVISWIFLITIVSPNAAFFVYWVLMMRIEILKELIRRDQPQIFRLLSCTS